MGCKLVFEAVQHLENQRHVGDELVNVVERVGEGLQLVIVGRYSEVALNKTVEVSLEVDGTSGPAVAKQTLEASPDGKSGGVGLHHHVEELRGDGVIEPLGDSEVLLDPFGIVMLRFCVVDVMATTILPRENEEMMTPLGVVRNLEI